MLKKIMISLFIVLIPINSVSAEDILRIAAPPSIWVYQNGDELTGPIIDVINEIFSGLNVSVRTEFLPWARAITDIESGKLDMIPVIFYTEERTRFMEFSIPYINVPTSVFVPKGKSFPYTTIKDLEHKRGLMMRGDSISPDFSAFEPKLNLTRVTNYEQLCRMLVDNRADYGVAARYGFLIEANKLGYVHRVEILPVPIASRSLHFAFSKKSSCLKYLPLVNEKLKEMQADGTIDTMVNSAISLAADKDK